MEESLLITTNWTPFAVRFTYAQITMKWLDVSECLDGWMRQMTEHCAWLLKEAECFLLSVCVCRHAVTLGEKKCINAHECALDNFASGVWCISKTEGLAAILGFSPKSPLQWQSGYWNRGRGQVLERHQPCQVGNINPWRNVPINAEFQNVKHGVVARRSLCGPLAVT